MTTIIRDRPGDRVRAGHSLCAEVAFPSEITLSAARARPSTRPEITDLYPVGAVCHRHLRVSVAKITMKNPPRFSPGGAMIQHSSKLPARRLSEFQPADADSQVASASRRICRIASATFAGSASGGRVLAVRWLRASHRCVGKQHRLKSEHALDGALVTGCRFVGGLL